jgi:hypothetical protein
VGVVSGAATNLSMGLGSKAIRSAGRCIRRFFRHGFGRGPMA